MHRFIPSHRSIGPEVFDTETRRLAHVYGRRVQDLGRKLDYHTPLQVDQDKLVRALRRNGHEELADRLRDFYVDIGADLAHVDGIAKAIEFGTVTADMLQLGPGKFVYHRVTE